MSVYKPNDRIFYHYDFQRSGQRFAGSTGEKDRRRAEAYEKALKAEVEEAIKASRRFPDKRLTLDAAAGRYWEEVGHSTVKPERLDAELERLVLLIGPATPLCRIDDGVLAEAIGKRRQDFRKGNSKRGRISAATVNRSVTQLLRRILTRARTVWKEPLPSEPNWKAHMLAEPKERVRELRHDEEAKLEEAERDDYRAPRLFAQITGLRRREVASLTWEQINFTAETISVVGKGDKPHVLPLTPELRAILEPLRGHHQTAVFTYVAQRSREVRRAGRKVVAGQRYPITYEGFATHFRRALAVAGIKDFRIHDLRHTAATRALRATGNLRFVQQLLAHSSPTVTARYAHADLADMRRLMAVTAADDAERRSKVSGPQGDTV